MEDTEKRNKNLKWIKQESKENYLKGIYILDPEGNRGVRYAELEGYFQFSKASVCKAVRALRDEGFVTIDGAYSIRLTEQGKTVAEKTYRKYCFFKELLLQAGIEPKQAEAEACKLEHGISSESLNNLISIYAGNADSGQ